MSSRFRLDNTYQHVYIIWCMDYFKNIKQVLNAAIAVANTKNIAIIGVHSLPLWFSSVPQLELPETILQHIQKQPLVLDLCIYSDTTNIASEIKVLNTMFGHDSHYAILHGLSLNAIQLPDITAPANWFSRCKKVRIGRYSLLVMHPVDAYYILTQTQPELAERLVTLKVITPNMLRAVSDTTA